MPDVQDFYYTFLLANLVIDNDRTMNELAHMGSFSGYDPQSRKPRQQVDVIEQRRPKLGGRMAIVYFDVADDLG